MVLDGEDGAPRCRLRQCRRVHDRVHVHHVGLEPPQERVDARRHRCSRFEAGQVMDSRGHLLVEDVFAPGAHVDLVATRRLRSHDTQKMTVRAAAIRQPVREVDDPHAAIILSLMPRTSAGLLMYRQRADALQVLLVHPGGPFWANKDLGAWTIPKGEVAEGEEELQTARREFEEETGLRPEGAVHPLGSVKQKGGKVVHAWAFEGDCDPAAVRSNTCRVQWPPGSGQWPDVPEVDRTSGSLRTRRGWPPGPGAGGLVDVLEKALATE